MNQSSTCPEPGCGFTAAGECSHATRPAAQRPRGAEQIAQLFHEAYERLAPSFGYKTRDASAVPWTDVPEPNRSLMIAVAAEVAGAAKHGDVKELRESHGKLLDENAALARKIELMEEALEDAESLRADICAVLSDDGLREYGAIGATRRIRDMIDRKPDRADPCMPCGKAGGCQRPDASDCIQKPAPRMLYDIVFPDHIEVDQLDNPETTIVRLRCLPHTFGPVSTGWVNRGDTHLIKEFVEAHSAHGYVAQPPSASTSRDNPEDCRG